MNLPALVTIYRRYETLSFLAQDRFAGSLAGKLLLRSGLSAEGAAELMAAGIAGACSLCVEPDAETLREALRAGLCDFVVVQMDEALRILKNELRRGRSVSVGLSADPGSTMAGMVDRGLQPDLLSVPAGEPRQSFIDRGAVLLPAQDNPHSGTAVIEWTLSTDAARAMPQIARMAAEMLDRKRADTPLRQRWLELAPRHLRRTFASCQCLRMNAAESAAFAPAVRAQFPSIQITGDASRL